MRKVIAAMNMTLDGFCDHTAMIADDEIHQHYNELLRDADAVIYGRITYQLMESYWPSVVKNPTGNQPMDEFAGVIDDISKIVFSHTLKNERKGVQWKNARVALKSVEEEIQTVRRQPGKAILIGSPSLIVAAMNLGLVDECQLSVQPTIAGKGLRLLKNIHDRIKLELIKTKTFRCGAVTFYYQPVNEKDRGESDHFANDVAPKKG
jgi:dihydrofolate reductase